jgi:Tfp pilus assembly protein PilF
MKRPSPSTRLTAIVTLLLGLALAGCETAPPAPPPPSGLAELMERPAERALIDAIRLYDNGQYTAAELSLQSALSAGLSSPRDQATAHKLLAFITCTSQRETLCETAFRAALAADPGFALSRAEAGHPMWGPVYRRVTAP